METAKEVGKDKSFQVMILKKMMSKEELEEEVEAEEKRRAEGEHGHHHQLARSAARCETVLLCHENASLSRILQVIQSSPTPMISGFMVTTV